MEIITKIESASNSIEQKLGKYVRKIKRHYRFGSEDNLPQMSLHVGRNRILVYRNLFAGQYRDVKVWQTDSQRDRAKKLRGRAEDLMSNAWRGANRWSREHTRMGMGTLLLFSTLGGGLTTGGMEFLRNLNLEQGVTNTTQAFVNTPGGPARMDSFKDYQLVSSLGK